MGQRIPNSLYLQNLDLFDFVVKKDYLIITSNFLGSFFISLTTLAGPITVKQSCCPINAFAIPNLTLSRAFLSLLS